MYIYIYIKIQLKHKFYKVMHEMNKCNESNFPSLLSPQWLRCNSCTRVHVHEFLQSHCDDTCESIFFSRLHIYYAHLALVMFEHSMRHG